MFSFPRAFSSLLVPVAVLTLSACAQGPGRAPDLPVGTPMSGAAQQTPVAQDAQGEAVKVAMLLPLTGKGSVMGTAMQNAAQLALNDLGYPNYELMFEDTASSPGGAERAARTATAAGAKLLIGPIFAEEAKAARPEADKAGATMMTFSTDTSVASPRTFVMGFLPQDQARQIGEFAAKNNWRRILVVAERTAYGQIITGAFTRTAQTHGLSVVGTIWVDGNIANLPMQLGTYFPAGQPAAIDAVFMPLPAERAARVARMMKAIPDAMNVQRLGTGLLDDANVTVYPDLVGTYYAAPAPQARNRFEQAYRRNFGGEPPRLASLGYDAVALSLMMARTNGAEGLTAHSLTNPNGFTGIDGLFRFRPDGVVERGLAIIQIRPGGREIAAPSPTTFMTTP